MSGLNIIVCIKQVPGTTEVEIDRETGRLKREQVEAVVNPFDEYGVEEGLRLREKHGGKVKVITMGPQMAETALRNALAMGCDEAWLITDRVFGGADTLATSYTLSLCVGKLAPFDIVICGLKTTDGDTGQVGPELAEHLGIPHICYVKEIQEVNNGKIRLKRILDDGVETLESQLPVLITVTKEINQPRLPSLMGRLRAQKAQVSTITSADIGGDSQRFGLAGSATKVINVQTPEPKTGGEKVTGDSEELAQKIFEKLLECKVI